MTAGAQDGTDLSPGLRAFLATDDDAAAAAGLEPGGEQPPLAMRRFFVEETLRSGGRSRFVGEGGVCFLRAESYRLTVDDLEPMAQRRVGISKLQLRMVKFYFTFTELPPNRSYAQIHIRINLDPPAPVLQLRPYLQHAQAQLVHSSGTEFGPALGKLVQFEMRRRVSDSISRTELRPIVTAFDHGPSGFGWTYQVQDGAPLFPRIEHTLAVLELPTEARTLKGTFDAEAIIMRRVLHMVEKREAIPDEPPTSFEVPLSGDGN
jgi:hypothetical protein